VKFTPYAQRLGRKIISVIELMGLSETEEQPRAAKEEKREGKRKTWMCTQA